MTSQKDKDSNFWNNINTEHILSPDDEDTINRLLVNPGFDELDLPEITLHQDLFTEKGQWVEIDTADDFHDPSLPMVPLVKDHPITSAQNPMEIGHTLTRPLPEAMQNSSHKPALTAHGPNSNASHSTYIDTTVALSPLSATVAPITAPDSKDKYDKPIAPVLESADNNRTIGHQNYLVQRSPQFEPLGVNTGKDKYEKTVVIDPLPRQESECLPETTTSLVENNTKERKTANISDLIPTQANGNNDSPKPTSVLQENQHPQTSVAMTATLKEAAPDSEWAIFMVEQEKTQQQLIKRVIKVEKQFRTALLFSLVAAILAGVSIIAAVSGLI